MTCGSCVPWSHFRFSHYLTLVAVADPTLNSDRRPVPIAFNCLFPFNFWSIEWVGLVKPSRKDWDTTCIPSVGPWKPIGSDYSECNASRISQATASSPIGKGHVLPVTAAIPILETHVEHSQVESHHQELHYSWTDQCVPVNRSFCILCIEKEANLGAGRSLRVSFSTASRLFLDIIS
ncbi:uncharacterized protein BT62DRAFT_1013704 [Guyanagaster necrorhizus]|uniref:Uncharacterized protein n=1 Tax=Guyanagaster necrorhizus TaxID=856835 RepID=A0A9P7VFA6_9AGAR|nr:uncharacterized protein BT62DRAFT_1013704 [Guyanagaster necrorhizus MCA 3950]KAG7439644.1 hypothetical protein BT62DRAFT_1013704 [Guyanagaster necrorhizus MCA 3950]